MAVNTRLIKRRIKSIGNTKKITKAMELTAASKMRKAVAANARSRAYSRLGREMIGSLAGTMENYSHPLTRENKQAKLNLMILVTSDRGLAGGYNAQVLKKTLEFIKGAGEFEFITVGKKGAEAVKRFGGKITASFLNMGNNPTIVDIRPIGDMAMNEFVSGKYGRVFIAYTDFVSSLRQEATITELLPLRGEDFVTENQESPHQSKLGTGQARIKNQEFIFEPDAGRVLDAMLPRMAQTQLYQTILESVASEHSSRMLAMRNATDAAGDMIDDLTFTFNQARQAGITREISEIAAGKAALE